MLKPLVVNCASILPQVISLVEILNPGYIVAMLHDHSGLVLCLVK